MSYRHPKVHPLPTECLEAIHLEKDVVIDPTVIFAPEKYGEDRHEEINPFASIGIVDGNCKFSDGGECCQYLSGRIGIREPNEGRRPEVVEDLMVDDFTYIWPWFLIKIDLNVSFDKVVGQLQYTPMPLPRTVELQPSRSLPEKMRTGSNPGARLGFVHLALTSGTQGFTAVEGFDPITGLGTPNFKRLLALWLSAK
ncbi:hypothetical protein DFH08DRAFT_815419 [Mycena albidolilacea]|uniref:Uncharacterized protein n=1 Tax=Mycena albidolilacea TaxID=1033008 RepID=A0AAD6ZPC6_9AGAR|nr:hypothetical protein DFH08DRAFT_815419 [Mycena albidolilacea]